MNRKPIGRTTYAARCLLRAIALFFCVQLWANAEVMGDRTDPGTSSFDHGMLAYEMADYTKAEARLREAAALGSARAHEMLGFMYVVGHDLFPGIPRNRRAASSHFLIAAASGSSTSAYMFCVLTADLPRRAEGRKICAARLVEAPLAGASVASGMR